MLLNYKKPDGSSTTVRLKELPHAPPVTIGRGKDATVVVDDEKCSRIHCAIRYWDDIFVIRDMNSSNGTYLNGETIDVAKLNPGDVVKIGDTELRASASGSGSDVTMRQ